MCNWINVHRVLKREMVRTKLFREESVIIRMGLLYRDIFHDQLKNLTLIRVRRSEIKSGRPNPQALHLQRAIFAQFQGSRMYSFRYQSCYVAINSINILRHVIKSHTMIGYKFSTPATFRLIGKGAPYCNMTANAISNQLP